MHVCTKRKGRPRCTEYLQLSHRQDGRTGTCPPICVSCTDVRSSGESLTVRFRGSLMLACLGTALPVTAGTWGLQRGKRILARVPDVLSYLQHRTATRRRRLRTSDYKAAPARKTWHLSPDTCRRSSRVRMRRPRIPFASTQPPLESLSSHGGDLDPYGRRGPTWCCVERPLPLIRRSPFDPADHLPRGQRLS